MKEKKIFQPLTSKNVCLIYALLRKRNLVSFDITQDARNRIEALVSNITNVYFGREIYTSFEEKAVAYLFFIIKNHPFVDGNKRTATLVFEVVCYMNNLNPDYSVYNLDALAIFIEKIQEKDHQRVIKQLSDLLFRTK